MTEVAAVLTAIVENYSLIEMLLRLIENGVDKSIVEKSLKDLMVQVSDAQIAKEFPNG